MRDPARIDRIMKLLTDKWKEHPDERFGQFLINIGVAYDSYPHWTFEDDELEKQLRGLKP